MLTSRGWTTSPLNVITNLWVIFLLFLLWYALAPAFLLLCFLSGYFWDYIFHSSIIISENNIFLVLQSLEVELGEMKVEIILISVICRFWFKKLKYAFFFSNVYFLWQCNGKSHPPSWHEMGYLYPLCGFCGSLFSSLDYTHPK